ncbi:glycoside hydrolase family 31 protein [Cohnella yongneupensis]|uniref:Glycoside hydrolase family 31 protein n=1 Tax=Cohnella yongneupensis TaxID=425006 RepID=A0ABW0R2P6_9BACL
MDNSLAIHPDQYTKGIAAEGFTDIGSVKAFARLAGGEFRFTCTGGVVSVLFYGNRVVRVAMGVGGGAPELSRDKHVLVGKPEAVAVEVAERDDAVELTTAALRVVVRKAPLRVSYYDAVTGEWLAGEGERGMMFGSKGEVAAYRTMLPEDRFYGFGEKAGFLDKRGEKLSMWNTDVYAPHNPETSELYVSIPFFLTLRGGRAFGTFLFNTFKTSFDLSGDSEYRMHADGGQLDTFVFAGPSAKDVVSQYTALTGRAPIPPKWALGYHQSRYSYETDGEVRELVRAFKEKGIPLDAVYLDIHYMNGYRVFTFDKSRFPDPAGLIKELRESGIRIIPIVDPGVKADPEYPVFREGAAGSRFCGFADGSLFYGQVWPEKSAFPDFTDGPVREWWGDLHAFYADKGIEGIWNDMNEPSVFNDSKTMDLDVLHKNDSQPATHRELHNQYGFFMSKATYEGMARQMAGRRPFVLTRAGFSGIQRYAAVWTGDNRSFWEHLEMSVPMCLNLGLSGVPLCGADVGGFAHDSNGELLARWTQVGALMPYFRNHSEMKAIRQEPWVFGSEVEDVARKYIQLRYRWLLYLYTLFAEASRTGVPVMRPLFMEFPEDASCYGVSDQYMLGSQVLVAPVVRPNVLKRLVYLPAGDWVNYWTDEKVAGGAHVIVDAPLDTLPIFVRAGTVLPLATARMNTEQPVEALELHVYLSADGSAEGTVYEDDGVTFAHGEGAWYEEKLTATRLGSGEVEVRSNVVHGGYEPGWGERRVVVHG